MCGRFALFAGPEELAQHFGVTIEDVALPPRYNLTPTQSVPIVRARPDDGRQLARVHWGLIPSWAKDPSIGHRMINARAETVTEKPAFRSAFKSRRCLIPTSGFYEWAQAGRGKQPYYIHPTDGPLFAFAGLWERWVPADGEPVESCAILTTTANATMAPVHDRMPVILPPDAYAAWLGELPASPETLAALLRPCPPESLTAYPVSRYVNAPGHEGPDCIAPQV